MADEAPKHPDEKPAKASEVTQAGQKILACDCPHCGRKTAAGGPGLALCNCCGKPVRF